MKKQTIAVDIDDVLSANAEAFIAYSNKRWGTALKVEDYREPWAIPWEVGDEEAKRRSEEYHVSGGIENYKHRPEAESALRRLAKNFRLVVVTSRNQPVEKVTRDWITKYFDGIFEAIHFAGMWDPGQKGIQLTKAAVLKEIGADYLIDDQLKHCIAAAQAGIRSLLFGNYAWNQTEKTLPTGVTRCKDWPAVLEYFDGRS